MSLEQLLTVQDVCRILQFRDPVTVRHLIRTGQIAAKKISKRWRIAPAALRAYMELSVAAR